MRSRPWRARSPGTPSVSDRHRWTILPNCRVDRCGDSPDGPGNRQCPGRSPDPLQPQRGLLTNQAPMFQGQCRAAVASSCSMRGSSVHWRKSHFHEPRKPVSDPEQTFARFKKTLQRAGSLSRNPIAGASPLILCKFILSKAPISPDIRLVSAAN